MTGKEATVTPVALWAGARGIRIQRPRGLPMWLLCGSVMAPEEELGCGLLTAPKGAPRKPWAPSTQRTIKPQPVANEARWSWGKIRDTSSLPQVTSHGGGHLTSLPPPSLTSISRRELRETGQCPSPHQAACLLWVEIRYTLSAGLDFQ